MVRRNRVTPFGAIEAIPLRGRFMGNRGCLHEGTDVVRSWRGKLWIVCRLDFRGRRVEQWAERRYTVLFFHDEAVAFAAGHRPCGECRHADYQAYRTAWAEVHGGPLPSAGEMNDRLHDERLDDRAQRRHERSWRSLPEGAFVVLSDEVPALVLDDRLVPWSSSGYGPPIDRPGSGTATVLTPPATLGVLAAGYRPDLALAVAD